MDKQREEFEKWYRENYDNSVIDDADYDYESREYESSRYWCDELNQSWSAWQQAQKVAVSDGFVLVPVNTVVYSKDALYKVYKDSRTEISQKCNYHIGVILEALKAQEQVG